VIKPDVDIARLTELLQKQLGQPPTDLAPIESGQIAAVYSFDSGGEGYVVRLSTEQHAESVKKDQFIAKMLAPTPIPVPPVLHTLKMDDLHVGISPRFSGVQLDQLPRWEYLGLIPAMIESLDDIRRVDISSTEGYGYFDGKGIGPSASWPEYLLGIQNEQSEGTFYGRWHHLFDETFMDRDYFDHVHGKMAALMEFCPPERYLVHSDYGWDNVLAQDGEITAVLDWANALLGDFLYDVAWMDIYSPELDLRAQFKEHFHGQGVPVENYEQRVLAYQCHISLESQMYTTMTNRPKDYKWICDRISFLLERG
jgi:hygromycin-B 4-O-kinase